MRSHVTALFIAAFASAAPAQSPTALRNPEHELWSRPAPATYRVRFETTKGAFTLEATRALAPHGADRFYHLVETGYYDDSRFFRTIQGRFVQFGIAGNPEIAAVWRDVKIPP